MRTLSFHLIPLAVALATGLSCPHPSRAQPCPVIPLPKEYIPGTDSIPYRTPAVRMAESVEGIPKGNPEGYRLSISRDGIVILCTDPRGEINARRTLSQLLSKDGGMVPVCEITDYPSFPIRGFLLDCGRTYMSLDVIKRAIDILSRLKINTFHWHLTENQAFRLESRLHPEVNTSSSMSRCPGLYYTHKEVRELEDFCMERGVTLIPEIDLPGHSGAFERATGYGMQTPEGKRILLDILREAAGLFRGEWFHIGTDETAFRDSTLVPDAVSLLRSLGKKVISWNPGWEYSSRDEIDLTQLWSYRGRPTPGVPYIDCRFHYINHFDSFSDVVDLQSSTVYGRASGEEDGARGAIVALWNDRMVEPEERIVVENALYQSAAALADRTWRGGGHQYFDRKGARLGMDVTDPLTADYLDFEKRLSLFREKSGLDFPFIPQGGVVWNITAPQDNGGDLSREWDYKALPRIQCRGAGIYLRHTWSPLVPGLLEDPRENSTVYAYTYVLSDRDRDCALMFLTQNSSRSEKDVPPPRGEWDWRDSYVKINGEAVPPPLWSEDLGRRDGEAPMGNLNSPLSTPLPVHLREGWNEVVIRLPVGKFTTREVRLVKWGFTFILTDREGKMALPVVYATEKMADSSRELR